MANWSDLKAAVAEVIKTNGNQEITGRTLQNVLNSIISNVGKDSAFAGIATPTTNPGAPDGNVFYLATEAGTYVNFNAIEIAEGEAVILEWRGSWKKKISGFLTQQKLDELKKLFYTDSFVKITVEWNYGYYYDSNGTLQSINNWESLELNVAQYRGRYIKFSIYTQKGAIAYGFLQEENGTNIWNERLGNDDSDIQTVINYIKILYIPYNAYVLKISNRKTTATGGGGVGSIYVNELINLSNLSNAINSVVKYLDITWNKGYYYNSNAKSIALSSWENAKIDISRYDGSIKYKIFTQRGATVYMHILSDEEKILLSKRLGTEYTGENATEIVTIEETILINKEYKYLLLSNRLSENDGGTPSIVNLLINTVVDNNYKTILGDFGEWNKGGYYDINAKLQSINTWEYLAPIDVTNYSGNTYHIKATCAELGYVSFVNSEGSIIEQFQVNGIVSGTIPENASKLYISNRGHYSTNENRTDAPYILIDNYNHKPTIKELLQSYENSDAFSGKTITFLGDSITQGVGASSNDKRYSTLLCKKLGAIENNLGLAGSALASNAYNREDSTRFITRATSEKLSNSSLIVIFGGTNDFSYDTKPIGNLFEEVEIVSSNRIGNKKITAPSDTDTFAGALHELINTVRSNCHNVPILLVTPINRGRFNYTVPTSEESNINGNFLYEFTEAITKIGDYYNIPVLNLSLAQLDFSNSEISSKYSSDNLHPNDLGHQVICDIMYKFISQNII